MQENLLQILDMRTFNLSFHIFFFLQQIPIPIQQKSIPLQQKLIPVQQILIPIQQILIPIQQAKIKHIAPLVKISIIIYYYIYYI